MTSPSVSRETPPTNNLQDAIEMKAKSLPGVQMGRYLFVSEPDDLDDFYLEKARKELRETPEVVAEGLKRIRELLKERPDLVQPDDDIHFTRFLRPCKWYPNSAIALMERFYRFRANYLKVCKNLLPSNERVALSSGVLLPLPLRTNCGCRLLLIEGGKLWNPKEVSLDQMFKGVMLLLDGSLAEPKTQVAGFHVIIDMDGLSLSQVTYFTPSFASMVVEWVQRCLPARLKGIHIVNQPFIFNMVFAIFKPFLQEKIRKRIFFHGSNKSSLREHINTEALPTWLGGSLDIPHEPYGDKLWKYICAFEDEYKVANTYGYVNKS